MNIYPVTLEGQTIALAFVYADGSSAFATSPDALEAVATLEFHGLLEVDEDNEISVEEDVEDQLAAFKEYVEDPEDEEDPEEDPEDGEDHPTNLGIFS